MTAGMIKVPSIMPLRIPGSTRKNMIDTNTLIELRTETVDTIIYYTINGAKPEPFKLIGEKCTYRYNKPFVLAPGKRTVKAMATSKDGTRESSVVTKTFLVEEASVADVEDEGSEIIQSYNSLSGNYSQSSRGLMSHILDNNGNHNVKRQQQVEKEAWAVAGNISSKYRQTSTPLVLDDSVAGSEHRKVHTEPRFMSERFGSSNQAQLSSTGQGELRVDRDIRRIPENRVHVNRTQQETDFLKCIYCYAARPSDPFARFCHNCGSPLPPLPSSRLPPPEGGQLGMCVSCHSMVPLNTPACIVCEAPMSPQRVPQASKTLQTKLLCPNCGTANPPDLRICVMCESVLPPYAKQIFSGESAPPLPAAQTGDFVTCSKCTRINSADARFCDWCGSKPLPCRKHMICSKCEAANNPYASYCNSCGCNIEPPPRISARSSGGVIGTLVERGNMHAAANSKHPTWLPVSMPSSPPETAERGTQTVGLFYPSSQTLQSYLDSEASEKARFESARDRRLSLAAVSPGRGYWRQQMDHVCSHLRAHAQNNVEFRNIIGEPRLGKIISATTCEDLNGEEFTITVTYARRDAQENFKQKTKAIANGLKALNISSTGSREDLNSSWQSSGKVKKTKKIFKKKNPKNSKKGTILKKEEKLLLAELGAKGQGRVEEVERLIEEGANPDCETSDGVPALILAIQNDHSDCLPVLQSSGADLNVKSPSKGNTALHEAVLMGPKGIKSVDILLNLGADANAKNESGQTPYDLAVDSGHDTLAQKFTSSLGNEMLQKLTKPHKVKHFIE